MSPVARPLADRLWDKVDRRGPDDCWEWTGHVIWNGYGRIALGRRLVLVHRVAYELLVGPIPAGLDLDHLCRNRLCVNPAHLEPVTRRVNIMRGAGIAAANAAKTHCPAGHPYDERNTIRGRNGRRCRACKAASERRRYRARRPAV